MQRTTEINLITFPRTGSFFLRYLIDNNMRVVLNKSHVAIPPEDGKTILSILRNPKDTIASYATMLVHYRKEDIGPTVAHVEKDYIEYCRYFIDCADIVVDYDLLASEPTLVLNTISQKLGLDLSATINADFHQEDMIDKEHLSSSKKSEVYQDVLGYLSTKDLSGAEEWYAKVKNSGKVIS